jgi:hypothetical protein
MTAGESADSPAGFLESYGGYRRNMLSARQAAIVWTNDVLRNVGVGGSFVAAVPEPSTWAVLLLGLAGIGFMAYRRKAILMAA